MKGVIMFMSYNGDNGILVDCDFPGGNIIVEKQKGNRVFLRQDLRDTGRHWFYWYFRVRGAAGRKITFEFTDGKVIGMEGPAVSTDSGKNWYWLGTENVEGQTFSYSFQKDVDEVFFSFGVPYLEKNLHEFLRFYDDNPHIKFEKLGKTRKGRDIERIHIGCLDDSYKYKVLLTCRHHCCEAMASYVLEGIMKYILSETANARWFSDNVQVVVIPFVDKDGVQEGDQGKGRLPHDHNRDYIEDSIYPSVKAVKEFVSRWAEGSLHVALDLHCPALRHKHIQLVGSSSPAIWEEQSRFSHILKKVISEPGIYDPQNNLPYGQGWNVEKNFRDGMNFSAWAINIPGIKLVSGIEIPYANASGITMTSEKARCFGEDLAKAIRVYLENSSS